MRILYFGTYNAGVGRNKVYISGLRKLGHEVLECRDSSKGFRKFLHLWRLHRSLQTKYDAFIVGCPGHAVVWLAKLIARKPLIFDAGWTMEEAVILSRGQRGFLGLNHLYIKGIDWLAVKCADVILVESEAQRRFFEAKFGASSKFKVLYTGVDDERFYPDSSVKKKERFTVLFRGQLLPEAGAKYAIEAAKLLEETDIDFLVMGSGFLQKELEAQIKSLQPKNLTYISEFVSQDTIRNVMLSCHVALSQLADHERLLRTIPHKCFETMAVGIPYISTRMPPVQEILVDHESVIFANPGDSNDLAEKIRLVRDNPALAQRIAENALAVFNARFTPQALAATLLTTIINVS